MIDPQTETLIPFRQARTAFPGGKKLAMQTLYRWAFSGVGKTRTKLSTLMVGGIRYTSTEAISRFIAAQNASESPAPAITAKQRRTQAETADRLLREAGI